MCKCGRSGKFALDRNFCSRYCYEIGSRKTTDAIEVNCYWCGDKTTLDFTQRNNNRLYCKRDCQYESNKGRKTKGGGGNRRLRLAIIQHLRLNMDKKLSSDQIRFDLEQNYNKSFRKNAVAGQLGYLSRKSIIKNNYCNNSRTYYISDKHTPLKALLS